MTPDTIVVLITVPSTEAGEGIARPLVAEHLAACVNVVPGLTSVFWWEGAVQTEAEALLIVKTRRPLFEALAAGSQAYLDWVRDAVSQAGETPRPA